MTDEEIQAAYDETMTTALRACLLWLCLRPAGIAEIEREVRESVCEKKCWMDHMPILTSLAEELIHSGAPSPSRAKGQRNERHFTPRTMNQRRNA